MIANNTPEMALYLQLESILNPIVILLLSIALVVFLLMRLKLPAFLALILAAFSVGIISPRIGIATIATEVAGTFGDIMTAVGIPILMAAIIGKCLISSGAAERIVRSLRSVLGSGQEDVTLLGSSIFLAIPVFFDTVFYLLAPLARSMRARTGGQLALYTSAIVAGSFASHALVPPTPGPLAVANEFGLNLGIVIVVGLAVGIPSSVAGGILYGRWVDTTIEIPLREVLNTTTEDMEMSVEKPSSELPSTFEALMPIILAIFLIMANNIVTVILPENSFAATATAFLGNANIALTVAALAAIWTFYRFQTSSLNELNDELTAAIRSGGNIIAITAAGGAFGAMLGAAGVGDFLVSFMRSLGIGPLVTAWLIAAVLIISTGSLTAAMITSAQIMASTIGSLNVHPVYLLIAIGTGGMFFAWHNSSPFWIINEIGGLNHEETVKTFSIVGLIMSITGLILTLLLSTVVPMA